MIKKFQVFIFFKCYNKTKEVILSIRLKRLFIKILINFILLSNDFQLNFFCNYKNGRKFLLI